VELRKCFARLCHMDSKPSILKTENNITNF